MQYSWSMVSMFLCHQWLHEKYKIIKKKDTQNKTQKCTWKLPHAVFFVLLKKLDSQNVNTTNFLCPLVIPGQVYLIFCSSFNAMNGQQIIWNHLLQKINDNKVHVHTLKSKKIFGFWSSIFLSHSLNMPLKHYLPIPITVERGRVGTEESPGTQARSEMLQHSLCQLEMWALVAVLCFLELCLHSLWLWGVWCPAATLGRGRGSCTMVSLPSRWNLKVKVPKCIITILSHGVTMKCHTMTHQTENPSRYSIFSWPRLSALPGKISTLSAHVGKI